MLLIAVRLRLLPDLSTNARELEEPIMLPGRRGIIARDIVFATVSMAVVIGVVIFFIAAYGRSSLSVTLKQNQRNTSLGFTALDRPAPQFSLPALDGNGVVNLHQSHGNPVVVNFWSSTCTVCQEETPAIVRVARALRSRIDFIGVDTLDEREAALKFAQHYGVSYPIAFDASGVAASRYGVPALPMTFFLSRSGQRILGVNVGALTARGLRHILHRLYGS
jgi:peroxiredoxin